MQKFSEMASRGIYMRIVSLVRNAANRVLNITLRVVALIAGLDFKSNLF